MNTTLDNGTEVEVDFTISKYYPATFWEPEEGGELEIRHIYGEVEHNGEKVWVDIQQFIGSKDWHKLEEECYKYKDYDPY